MPMHSPALFSSPNTGRSRWRTTLCCRARPCSKPWTPSGQGDGMIQIVVLHCCMVVSWLHISSCFWCILFLIMSFMYPSLCHHLQMLGQLMGDAGGAASSTFRQFHVFHVQYSVFHHSHEHKLVALIQIFRNEGKIIGENANVKLCISRKGLAKYLGFKHQKRQSRFVLRFGFKLQLEPPHDVCKICSGFAGGALPPVAPGPSLNLREYLFCRISRF